MAWQIFKEEERVEVKIDGPTFVYRRVVPAQIEEIQETCIEKVETDEKNKSKEKGKLSFTKFCFALLEYAILDWKDVKDAADSDTPFIYNMKELYPTLKDGEAEAKLKEIQRKLLRGLPFRVIKELVDVITKDCVDAEKDLKNSPSTTKQ